MTNKIGFYGAGNMGQAMIKGLISSKLISPNDIYVNDHKESILNTLRDELNVNVTIDNIELSSLVNIIILAVKPNQIIPLLDEIKNSLNKDTLIISIAAGVSINSIEASLSNNHKIIRVMPNTPVLVNEGMSAVAFNNNINDEEKAYVLSLLNSFGIAEEVNENLFDAVIGVSGSSPAYAYLFIEALADGAVVAGMNREQAYRFAAQALKGAAQMVIETNEHPAVLKDRVCSPGGTTIAAINSLEEDGFRSSVIKAVLSAANKNKELEGR